MGLATLWLGSTTALGLLTTLAGAALVVLGALRLPKVFDTAPALTVDAAGFFDRRFTRRPVAWDDITTLRRSSAGYAWPVLLTEEPPEDRTWRRRLYCAIGYPYLYVDQDGLDRGGGDVLLAIVEHAPRLAAGLRQDPLPRESDGE